MFDKPLFSRRQLNIIILVTALAIALLSATGDRRELPEISLQQQHQIPIYLLENDQPDTRISLSFALPEPLIDHRPFGRFTRQVLHSNLTDLSENPEFQRQNARISIVSHPDRVEIRLAHSDSGAIAALAELLIAQLRQPPERDRWQQMLRQHRAESYLEKQSADPALLQMRNWLAPSAPGTETEPPYPYQRFLQFQNQLLSRSRLSIALISADPESLVAPLAPVLSRLPEGAIPSTQIPAPLPIRQQTLSGLDNNQILLGRHTSGRRDADFATELTAVRLLQTLAGDLNINSQWSPLAAASPLILQLITTDTITPGTVFERLQQQLQQLSDDQLDQHRQQLLERFSETLKNPERLAGQLESIAFYRQPPDYLNGFVSRLNQLSSREIRDRTEELLDSQQYHRIIRTTSSQTH